jgi:hypothetical protein
VSAKRHHVRAKHLYIQKQISRGLDSICMEQNILFFANFSDFFNWVDRTDLIVGVHHRDNRGVLAKRF